MRRFNLSDRDQILNYINSRIDSKKYGDMEISVYISEGYVYDVSLTIGAYVLGYIDIWGKNKVYNIIYELICKTLCEKISEEMNINQFFPN